MKLQRLLIIALFIVSINFAQADFSFFPSVYYTYGSYTDERTSNSIALYMPFTWNGFDYVTVGYDNLNINNPSWKYHQQLFLASSSINYFPLYLKVGYLHIKGSFNYNPNIYHYNDFQNLFSVKVLLNESLLYFGLSFDYSNLIGYRALSIKHYGGSFQWLITPEIFLELKPVFTSVTDGRKLFSSSFNLNYSHNKYLLLKLFGFIGKRAYYFDEDLLTMFNQNETQKNLAGLRAEYNLIDELTLVSAFEYTKFEDFTIRYFVAGLKYNF